MAQSEAAALASFAGPRTGGLAQAFAGGRMLGAAWMMRVLAAPVPGMILAVAPVMTARVTCLGGIMAVVGGVGMNGPRRHVRSDTGSFAPNRRWDVSRSCRG
jgi:hypothetical protein